MAAPDGLQWLLVCGGFHDGGGMDRLNAAVASFIAAHGDPLHLVAHDVDDAFVGRHDVSVTIVRRPAGSAFLGELALDSAATVRAAALRRRGRTVVIGNGGNCSVSDVNWVHCVHAAWPCRDAGAPILFRVKNRTFKTAARIRERQAIRSAGRVIANSARTHRDVLAATGIHPSRLHTVYPGAHPSWRPPPAAVRRAARRRWVEDVTVPLFVFIGALGHDTNKGIDRVLDAWRVLRSDGGRGQLLVAGHGDLPRWHNAAGDLQDSVRFLGHIDNVVSLLDAADVLLSPVSHEAYGLAVQEAICRGVPAIVTRTAGIVERLPESLADLWLPPDPVAADVIAAVRRWQYAPDVWRERTLEAGDVLTRYTERDMAADVVRIAATDRAMEMTR